MLDKFITDLKKFGLSKKGDNTVFTPLLGIFHATYIISSEEYIDQIKALNVMCFIILICSVLPFIWSLLSVSNDTIIFGELLYFITIGYYISKTHSITKSLTKKTKISLLNKWINNNAHKVNILALWVFLFICIVLMVISIRHSVVNTMQLYPVLILEIIINTIWNIIIFGFPAHISLTMILYRNKTKK